MALSKKKVVAKKKVSKKKVSKKKVVAKKVSKKKVSNALDDNEDKLFATEEEKLRFLHGVSEQRFYNEKIKGSRVSLELYMLNHNKKLMELKADILRAEQERQIIIRDYGRSMDLIKKRLDFEGGFGINPETNEVIPHPAE